jgi:hypothetical protein
MYHESNIAEWLCPQPGSPVRRGGVFVTGVEAKAISKTLCNDTFTLIPL